MDSNYRANRLNAEADGLRDRISSIEQNRAHLQANRQFAQAHEQYEDQIVMLEQDKQSLMKRLNLVLSELEQASKEKSDVSQKLRHQEGLADDLKRKLEEVSSIKNVVNRNLQEDLRYERELNEKLRGELDRFQMEKDSMLGKLREQEMTREDIARETNEMNTNLVRKNDELRKLEGEHESNCHRLRELNDQLELMRDRTLTSQTQKRRLEDDLGMLTAERDDLVRKMNELNARYEDYVATMNGERAHIIRTNKTHIRLLTAKLLFQVLGQALDMRAKYAIQEIKQCSNEMGDLERRIYKFVRVMQSYQVERKRQSLRKWYRNAMNFVHENYKNQNLVRFNVNKKLRTQFFYRWRKAYLNREKAHGQRMDGLNVLRRWSEGKEARTMRRYICHWRDICLRKERQQQYVLSLMMRKGKMTSRRAFIMWLGHAKRQRLEERCEHMGQIITTMWFKQKIFLSLKLAAMNQQADREVMKFQTWKAWCEQARKDKYFEKKSIMVDKIDGTRTEMLLKRVFDAIRYSNVNDKFEATRQELEEKIPIRQELERQKDELIKMSNQKDKINLFKNCFKRYQDVLFRGWQEWRDRVFYYKHTTQRMKLRLINLHRQNLSKTFARWKEVCDKRNLKMLTVTTEDLQNENQNLTNTIENQRRRKGTMAVRSTNRRQNKLVRVRNMLNRLSMKRSFKKWIGDTEYKLNIEDATLLGDKIMYKRRLRNAFHKFHLKVKLLNRYHHILQRVDWFVETRDASLKNDVYQSLKLFMKRSIIAKKFLFRVTNSVDKQLKNEAMSVWKHLCSKARQKVFMDHITVLNERKEHHEEQINHFRVKIEQNESKQRHLVSKMQSQAHRIMGNFIVRMNNRQIARGFYKWFDVCHQENQKLRFMRKALLYWHRRSLSAAFRTWSEIHFRDTEVELAYELDVEEEKRRALQKRREQEEREHLFEAQDLSEQVQKQNMLKDKLTSNFDGAFQTLVRRTQDNQYIDKRRNILLTWADFIRKEKNAVNTIGAIARKTLRMEVFQRIRLVARENSLDKDAHKKMLRFFNLVRFNMERKAMVTWRKNSYAQCVESMVEIEVALKKTLNDNDATMSRIINAKHIRAEKLIRLKQLRRHFNSFVQMVRYMKLLRTKQGVLGSNCQFLKEREALRLWYKRVKVTVYFRKRTQKMKKEWNAKLMRTCFEAMKTNSQNDKRFMRKMVQIIKRARNLDMAKGFQHWHHTAQSMRQRDQEANKYGARSVGQILDRMLKRRMQAALYSLKNRSQLKAFKERYLQRAMIHTAEYRLKHFFAKWRHNVERINLAHLVNTEGDVVLERNQAQRNAKRLREELINSGYAPEYIDEYLALKSETQRSNMQKSVVTLFFKNTDFNIITKALNQWRAYIKSRRIAKENARYVLNCLNHPLTIYFKRWKYEKGDAEKVLDKLSKRQLIDKVVADENLIGSSKSRIQRMDQAIDHLNIQRDNLLEHFIKGQRLALAKVNNNCLATMFRAFARWKKRCQEAEQALLADELARTTQMIEELKIHVDKLEGINKNLLVENEELRSAALDGIEIAKAVQDLTKERETLSGDLATRAQTIRGLIEENQQLSLRLTIAQKEAGLDDQ